MADDKYLVKGTVIGTRYSIIGYLGEGSFGIVYTAQDLNRPNKKSFVAIKILQEDLWDDQEALGMFEKEAEVLERLNHKNILKIVDFNGGKLPHYIVTALAEGGSLTKKICPNRLLPPVPMPLLEVAEYLEQICAGLEEAHNNGLIHRDLKPDNILLDENNRPLIADFGLATSFSKSKSIELVVVKAGGTAPYMAPEIWIGKAGKPSDIYALAVMTYQMITGQRPYQGYNDSDFYRQHTYAPIPKLSEPSPSLVYPIGLDNVISAGMAKNPETRIRSANEFFRRFKAAIEPPETQPTIPIPINPVYIKTEKSIEQPENQPPVVPTPVNPVPVEPIKVEALTRGKRRLLLGGLVSLAVISFFLMKPPIFPSNGSIFDPSRTPFVSVGITAPVPTAIATISPTPTTSPTVAPSPSPTTDPTATASPTPTIAPSPTATATASLTATPNPILTNATKISYVTSIDLNNYSPVFTNSAPYSLFLDKQNNLFVTDDNNYRTLKLDLIGKLLYTFGGRNLIPPPSNPFFGSYGVTVDPQGNVYISDTFNDRIQKFDKNNNFIGFLNSPQPFSSPRGLASDSQGNIFVMDSGNNLIQKINSNGVWLHQWGSFGSGNYQFKSAGEIAVDVAGNVYVADKGNNRIIVFDNNGGYKFEFGSPKLQQSTANAQFYNPTGVAVDIVGNIYVVDGANRGRIQKFDSKGNFQMVFGNGYGTANIQFSLPEGLVVDNNGYIYVADVVNHRVVILKQEL